MKTLATSSMLLVLLVGVSVFAQPSQPWQVLGIHDKEQAFVYEVFFKAGKVQYLESYATTAEEQSYLTDIPSVGADPVRGFWTTKPERGDRLFGAHSDTPTFAQADVINIGDAAAWVFRQNAAASPSAIIVGLRNATTPVGASGIFPPRSAKIILPAKSVARAAVIFRRSANPLYIDSDQVFLEGAGETGDFLTLAKNDNNSSISITLTGWTVTNSPIPGTKRFMILGSKPAGNNVTLIAGKFPSEPECFVAAVIISPLP